jgi:hypothetical protein
MKNKTISTLILFFILFFSLFGYSQKIKSDGYTCIIKDVTKETLRTCGTTNIVYKGLIVVKSKSNLKGTYPFYFAGMGNSISLLTIKNTENKPISPTLLFDELKREFYFKNESQQRVFIADEKTENEIILEGMIIWLKIKDVETGK